MEECKRVRSRVIYSAHALVECGGKKTIKGMVRDVAIDSLYLHIKPIFEIDEQVQVEIILLGVDSQLTIKVPAIVVRIDQDGVAMRFFNRLEWWPIFTFFPCHRIDSDNAPLED